MLCWRKTGNRGQALVEWAIFGVAILFFWTASFKMAKRLLATTVAQSLSMIAARQSLSSPLLGNPSLARVVKNYEGAKVESRIEIPKLKPARLLSTLPFFGPLFSPSSE